MQLHDPGFYEFLVNNSQEIICLHKVDGTILYASPSFYSVTGYTEEEVMGKILYSLLHTDDVARLREEAIVPLLNGQTERTDIVYRLKTRKGVYRWFRTLHKAIRENDQVVQILSSSRDISEKVAIKEQMRTHEKLYASASRIAQIGGWQLTIATGELQWSAEVKRIHEVPPDYVPDLNRAIGFYAPVAQLLITEAMHNAIETGKSWDLEMPLITAKGRHIWVRAQGEIMVEDGIPVKIFGAFQDITESRNNKEKIKLSEWKFRAIFNSMSQFIGLLTIEGTILEANESALRFIDMPMEKLAGKPFWSGYWWTDVSRSLVKEYIKRAAQGETIRTELTVNSVHQNKLILDFSITPLRDDDGRIILLIPEGRNISRQRHNEEKLIESKAQFYNAFYHSSIGMALVGTNGSWIETNEALSEMIGYSAEELVLLTFQDITHPDDLEHDLQHTHALLEGTGSNMRIEKRYIHKKGHIVWTILNATLIRNAQNKPLYFISQIQDITSLKQAQHLLEQKNHHLSSITEHLTRKNRQLAEFAQILSHNLRAPVGNITMLLQHYDQSAQQEEKTELVSLLKQSTHSLSDTLNELNEVLKVQQYKFIQKEQLHFQTVAQKVLKMLAALITDLNAIIHTDFSSAPNIDYPPIYLESIILNLVSNALKYHSPERTPVIHLRTYRKQGDLILEIEDNGRGINLDRHRSSMFKLYKTFHRHPDAKGLGLYMTKNQVEAMGGQIFVYSTEFEGSKFIINFNQYQISNGA